MALVWFVYFGQWSIRPKKNKLLSKLYQRPSFNNCHIVCLQSRKIVKIGCFLKQVAILVSNVCIPRGWVGRFDTLPQVTFGTFKTVWPAFTVRGCFRRGRKILEGDRDIFSFGLQDDFSVHVVTKKVKEWKMAISGLSLIASTRIFLEKAVDMVLGSSSCYAISSTSQLRRS